MKKDRWLLRSVLLLALSALLMTTALAAEAGSTGDPLVTLSYLNETFFNSIMQRVDQKIAQRNGQLNQQGIATGGSASATFTVCVSPADPGLIDETTAATLANGGALVQNHLYMMTIDGRGVRATAGTTKVLARGSYSVA